MTPRFVHLHLHSEYSLADSTIRIGELVKRSVDLGQPAVALTDINMMSPGGTTERAIAHMEEAELRTIIADAMQACAQRADAMAKELGQHT